MAQRTTGVEIRAFLQSKMPAKGGEEGRSLILSANSLKKCPF